MFIKKFTTTPKSDIYTDARVRSEAFREAGLMLRGLALQFSELPNGIDVALECAEALEEYGKLAPTITKHGYYPCQVISNFLVEPEIDYTSGFPRK